MKIGATEIKKLRGSLVLLCLASVIGGTAIYYGLQAKSAAARELKQAQTRLADANARLGQISREEQEIKTRAGLFAGMKARGMIGDERRLEWVELIRQERDENRLFEIDYELSATQKLGDDIPGGYEFHGSLLKFTAPLLHEEDVLRLLDGLQRKGQALVVPRRCELSRSRLGPGERGSLTPQLTAECMLQWITLREVRPAEGKR